MTERSNNDAAKKSPRVSISSEDDELVFAVFERFLQQMERTQNPAGTKKKSGAATSVAEWLAEERNRPDLNREKIYPLIWEAFRRKFLLLRAPLEKTLRAALIKKFSLEKALERSGGDVDVVNVVGQIASQHVSSVAADRIIDLIYQVGNEKKAKARANGDDPEAVRVHLGFGAGYAAMEVARRLADRADAETPKLTLHAISPGGFYIAEQQKDPTTYFSYFVDKGIDVQCVGFFSPPVVSTITYERLKLNPALRRCYEMRNEIDIIVTSLAAASDKHGLFGQYFNYLKQENLIDEDVLATLRAENWVGDVMFQPYSAEKAVFPKEIRAVALFDFNDLVEFSRRPGKRVVVIGGPCGDCGALKTKALRPLLAKESLRLWTSLIVDRETAKELLRDDQ